MWHNKESFPAITDSNYNQFIEQFKETSRPVNPNINRKYFLFKMFYGFNINITLIGFHTNRAKSKTCIHKSKKKCYSLIYTFVNYNASLLFPNSYPNVTFCEFESNIFLVHQVQHMTPLLTLIEPKSEIQINQIIITKHDILKILQDQKEDLNFPFSIALYSSYQFVPNICKYQEKKIENHLIRYYEAANGNDAIHLFLTPYLDSYDFSIEILPVKQIEKAVNVKNNFALQHVPEGIKVPIDQHSSSMDTDLDETYCICQHPDTQFVPIQQPRQYSHLGKKMIVTLL